FVVADDVIAILGNTPGIAQVALKQGGGSIHFLRVPHWAVHKPFVLGAEHVTVPTPDMPCPVLFAHHLCNFTARRVVWVVLPVAQGITAILQSVDAIMDAGL